MANLYISIQDEDARLIVDGNLQLFHQLMAAIDRGRGQAIESPQNAEERRGLLPDEPTRQLETAVEGVSYANNQ